MKTSLYLLAFIATLFVSCESSYTEKSSNYADDLNDALNNHKVKVAETVNGVTEALETNKENLTGENIDRKQAAMDFEEYWNVAIGKFKELEQNFTVVGETSSKYFSALEANYASIKDVEKRNTHLARAKTLKDNYAVKYSEASANLDNVREALRDGSDYHKILVGAMMEADINKNIQELEMISNECVAILTNLEKFANDSKHMLNLDGM